METDNELKKFHAFNILFFKDIYYLKGRSHSPPYFISPDPKTKYFICFDKRSSICSI